MFWNYCNQLYSQINGGEGGFCLSDKEENLSFSQNCFFVWDYFSLPVNDKKTVGKLYKSLQEIAQNSFPQEYDALCTAFATFFSKLNSLSDCAITYNVETGVANLFKAFDVALEGADSLLESLCLFLQSKAHFFGTKCFLCAISKPSCPNSNLPNCTVKRNCGEFVCFCWKTPSKKSCLMKH